MGCGSRSAVPFAANSITEPCSVKYMVNCFARQHFLTNLLCFLDDFLMTACYTLINRLKGVFITCPLIDPDGSPALRRYRLNCRTLNNWSCAGRCPAPHRVDQIGTDSLLPMLLLPGKNNCRNPHLLGTQVRVNNLSSHFWRSAKIKPPANSARGFSYWNCLLML